MLVYKANIWNIPLKIIYTFDKNKRLRAAGYIVDKPVHNVDHIARYAIKLHNMPKQLTNGWLWKTNTSLIYWEAIVADYVLREYSKGGGALAPLIGNRKSGPIPTYWVGVWGYMDLNFLEELTSKKYPMDTLTWYEKRLLGALTPRAGVRYKGNTLPSN